MTSFLEQPSRFLFFTGKGGVGKTALACATAIRLADAGKRILLVSTDPASNLDEMLGVPLSQRPTPIPGVDRLFALNIDPEKAADDYRKRVVAPYLAIWSETQIAELREQLAGACTVEIAAFDEFAELLAGDEQSVPFDHVLFDTAPTGHTLRLLSLPRAWSGFLQSTPSGASCLGPHSGLKMQEARFVAAVDALADAARTTIVLVTRADHAALREADRTSGELEALGLKNQRLVVNAVFEATNRADSVALALEERGREALHDMPPRLQGLPTTRVPLRAFNMVGLPALRALLDDRASAALARAVPPLATPSLPPLQSLIDEIAAPGRGLVMVMGKGGVGKTTIAASIAAELASRGHDVHLSTTDPAAHVAATLAGELPHLRISRIDPAVETKAYVDRVMATRGAKLDEAGRALLAEDLRSPCYEEVAVFAAFSRTVSQARSSFVVLDTAPTGHTLLLLDATGSYHRQTVVGDVDAQHASGRIVTPLMRLRDPQYTKVLVVTLAETTPVSEAARLQADLRRAGIEPFGWVINSSLAAAGSTDPCLAQRIAAELEQIRVVREQHAQRLAIVPWMTEEPVGPTRLLALARPSE
ncbi:arsenical pump-driving ATPase [Polyangium sp. y55x31]|uniref:arsenical pump-driving ATPase n=1 Tax=Polyangium sp. y55x31 TaxID=3042688 RepID=UPI002482A552|nr:arsenical pump-driving ATPase [Polyangium sp. y55x31]MDI1484603.1 arsenical pump-driving ATPase [Polyangium sp. y55x31]